MEIWEGDIRLGDNTLRDLQNSSDDTKAELCNNCFIVPSKQFLNELTFVDVKFISKVYVYREF